METKELKCGDCSAPMVLRETKRFLTRDGQRRKFFGCTRWPDCKGTHGAHPDGKPLGTPASVALRQYRHKLHLLLDQHIPHKSRQYSWLKKFAPKGHIGEMDWGDVEKTYLLLVKGKGI